MMNKIDFFDVESKEDVKAFFNYVMSDLIDFKISSPAIGRIFDNKVFSNIQSIDIQTEEIDISEIYAGFKKDIIPYCQNPSNKAFLGFPYSGNSIPGVTGAIISDFLNNNLVDFKLSEALTFCEIQTIIWLRKLIGYKYNNEITSIFDVGGVHTHGGAMSNTIALILSRENHNPTVLKKGVKIPDKCKIVIPKGISHYGIRKSQMLIGCGANCIEVPTLDYKIDLKELEEILYKNIDNVMCVIAFAGDAKTGTIDHLLAISNLVKSINPKIWLHADASQGFCLAFSDKLKHKLAGLEDFDSITIDPHKCLNIPFSISTLLVKDPSKLKVFDDRDIEDSFDFSFGRITPFISSRPPIALKLWFTLKTFGKKKTASIIEARYLLTQSFAVLINDSKDFILIGHPDTFAVLFCYSGELATIQSDEHIEFLNKLNDNVEKVLLSKNYFVDRPRIFELPGVKNNIPLKPLKYLCGNPLTEIKDLNIMIEIIRNEFGRK